LERVDEVGGGIRGVGREEGGEGSEDGDDSCVVEELASVWEGKGRSAPSNRIIVLASPIDEESALHLAAHRKLATAPTFPPSNLTKRAAKATRSATTIFAGY
jgi:hypothetical protein